MTITQPKRRNGQIRTYWRLLQFGIATRTIGNITDAKALYSQFQILKIRVENNPKDPLSDVALQELLQAAQTALGMTSRLDAEVNA